MLFATLRRYASSCSECSVSRSFLVAACSGSKLSLNRSFISKSNPAATTALAHQKMLTLRRRPTRKLTANPNAVVDADADGDADAELDESSKPGRSSAFRAFRGCWLCLICAILNRLSFSPGQTRPQQF